jgi:hypothetical protein
LAFQQKTSELSGGSDADKRSIDSISSRRRCRQPTSAFALQQPKTLEFIKEGKLAIAARTWRPAPEKTPATSQLTAALPQEGKAAHHRE